MFSGSQVVVIGVCVVESCARPMATSDDRSSRLPSPLAQQQQQQQQQQRQVRYIHDTNEAFEKTKAKLDDSVDSTNQ